MTYLLLNAVFLAAVAVLAIAGTRLGWLKFSSAAVTLQLGILMLMATAVFDNLIIGTGIVAYDLQKISGLFIGIAPIEDFAYTLAAVIALPAIWNRLRAKK